MLSIYCCRTVLFLWVAVVQVFTEGLERPDSGALKGQKSLRAHLKAWIFPISNCSPRQGQFSEVYRRRHHLPFIRYGNGCENLAAKDQFGDNAAIFCHRNFYIGNSNPELNRILFSSGPGYQTLLIWKMNSIDLTLKKARALWQRVIQALKNRRCDVMRLYGCKGCRVYNFSTHWYTASILRNLRVC